MIRTFLLFLCCGIFYCSQISAQSTVNTNKTYTVAELQADFKILRNSFEEGHAGLYRYNSKQEFDHYFDSLYACIKKPQTELEFYRFLTPLIHKIRCIHSWVSTSDAYQESDCYFPLPIKIIEDKAYADCDYGTIKFGTELIAINGTKMQEILEKLYKTRSTDGFNTTFLRRIVEYSFFAGYKEYINDTTAFAITIKAPLQTVTAEISLKGIGKDSLRKVLRTRHLNKDYRNLPSMSYTFQNDSIVVLNIETFDEAAMKKDKIDYYKYLKAFFKEIENKGVKNLIIDLRRNSGGNSVYNPELFSYLTDKPFDVFASIEINTIDPSFLQYTEFAKQEKQFKAELKKQFKTQNKEGKYEAVMEANYLPKKNNFKGNVYLQVSGLTGSTAARFTDVFSVQKRGTIIGEEPGGGYFGNNGGIHAVLTLPNTKLSFDVPLFKFVMAGNLNKNWYGHGVQPDYPIHPTIKDYEAGKDPEMEFTLDLVKNKQNKK